MSQLRQQGTALFMALLIVAIVTSITVFLMRSQQIDIKRTEMMLTSEQAYLYAQGVIAWAKGAIELNAIQQAQKQANKASNKKWPMILPPTTIANRQGRIAGVLQDAQGLINLNNFSTNQQEGLTITTPTTPPTGVAGSKTTTSNTMNAATGNDATGIFVKLLTILNLASPQQGKNLVNAITAWISNPNKLAMPKQNVSSNNTVPYTDSYDTQYSKASTPYHSPHTLMVSASELRMVAGVTPKIYNGLLPYIIALPTQTTLNEQHAPPAILQALKSSSQQQSSSTKTAPTETQSSNSLTSEYFLLRADVYLRNQHLILYALLQGKIDLKSNQQLIVNTLWQSFGTI